MLKDNNTISKDKFQPQEYIPIGCKNYPNVDIHDCVGAMVTKKREISVYNRRTQRIEHIYI